MTILRRRRSDMSGKVGVAITTHNRREVMEETHRRWRALLPKDAVLIVVDDGSDEAYPRADFRFEKSVGIARAKNKCLELLEEAGVVHAFLSDSDCYPINRDWFKPYVKSPEPHLSYQFPDLVGPVKLHDIHQTYRDSEHVAYTGQRGCMLYFDLSKVLPTVGGFDPIYGRALYEHMDLADRIHHAGLTTWRYGDVVNSSKYWHSMDEYVQVARTVPNSEMRELYAKNKKICDTRKAQNYQAFVPYKEMHDDKKDVVITTFLTSNVDPQRGTKWDPDARIMSGWLESMERGDWKGIILADELKHLPIGYQMELEKVPSSTMNVYYQRWLHIYQYLRDHPELRWVWCTDASDVEVLRDPFEGMTPGKLYVGSERDVVGCQWMIQNHPHESLQRFIHANRTNPLLNAGVVGGDRLTVQELAQQIVKTYFDLESERLVSGDTSRRKEVGDMAVFNKVAYETFGSRIIMGPQVTTDFKAYRDNGTAKFKHK